MTKALKIIDIIKIMMIQDKIKIQKYYKFYMRKENKIMEMEQSEINKTALYLFNSIKI